MTGLVMKPVASRFLGDAPVGVEGVGRLHDDGQLVRMETNLLQRLDAVHHGHFNIHQYGVGIVR